MPYKDETKRREYDKAYKQKRRSEGWTKKGLDMRLTEIEVETAEDLRDLLNEVVAETRDADSASLVSRENVDLGQKLCRIGDIVHF